MIITRFKNRYTNKGLGLNTIKDHVNLGFGSHESLQIFKFKVVTN